MTSDVTGIFTKEQLDELSFSLPKDAYHYLKTEAIKCGFKICTESSCKSAYIPVHCSKGGRVRGKTTSKINCPWSVLIFPYDIGKFKIRARCLEHNHKLTPDEYSIFTLGPDKQAIIRRLLDSGIKPAIIQSRECFLCGAEHTIVECEQIDEFVDAVEYNLSIEASTSRCSLCKSIGHNRTKCRWHYANK